MLTPLFLHLVDVVYAYIVDGNRDAVIAKISHNRDTIFYNQADFSFAIESD